MKNTNGKIYKTKKIIAKITLYLILSIMAAVFVFPFFAMFSKSLMTTTEYWSPKLHLWSDNAQWSNYTKVFEVAGNDEYGVSYMLIYLWNTLKIVVLATVGLLFSASICAYGFCKIKFPGRDLMFSIVLATTMIPSAVMLIPLYSLYTRFGWIDTSYPMWAGMWFGGGAINIFLVKQYMSTLPKELNESAAIDGAGLFRQYFQVILPNCKPILAVISIGAILGPWNDVQTPLMYLESQSNYTLALGIAYMRTGADVEMPILLAACTLMTILPIVAFVFNQKFFVESVVTSGVKG